MPLVSAIIVFGILELQWKLDRWARRTDGQWIDYDVHVRMGGPRSGYAGGKSYRAGMESNIGANIDAGTSANGWNRWKTRLVIPGSKADWITFRAKHLRTVRPERKLNPAEKKSLKNKRHFYSDPRLAGAVTAAANAISSLCYSRKIINKFRQVRTFFGFFLSSR
jgi:hypothetical protein